MSKGKSIYRWIGEAVLVFASVLGAFLVEDYRHNRQEEQDYVNTLEAFRNDVHTQIWLFAFTYDKNVTDKLGIDKPLMISDLDDLNHMYDLLNDRMPNNNFEALKGLMEWPQMQKMRHESQFYKPLGQYASYLLSDSLSRVMHIYDQSMRNGAFVGEGFNEILKKFKEYAMPRVDLSEANNIGTKEMSDSFMLRNTIIRLVYEIEEKIIPIDQDWTIELSNLVIEMDAVLANYGIDTSALSRDRIILNVDY